MTKEVLVTVRGIQRDDAGEQGITETALPGEYYFRNGSHYILYEERAETSAGCTRNRLKLNGNRLEVVKKGGTDSRMVFETGKRHQTVYATPFGTLHMETVTGRISLCEEEERIRAGVEYELWACGEKVSSCRLTINIEPMPL